MGLLVLVIIVLGLTSYFVTADFAVVSLPNAVSQWTSNLVRLSSSAVPGVVGFGYLYSKVKARYVLIALIVYIVLGAVLVPRVAIVLQTSQNQAGVTVDRLSFDYRAPYYRMYQIAGNSGRNLIIGGAGEVQMAVFASMLPNVIVSSIPSSQQEFDLLVSKNWSAIYLYDNFVTILSPSLVSGCQCYPIYYQHIVLSHSYDGYSITPIWVDGESYALRLVKA